MNTQKQELNQDASFATQLGPPRGRASTPAAQVARTPRWVWRWLLVIIVLIFLYSARTILGPFVIAGVLAYIFSIVVDQIQTRLNLPRALIVTVLYVVVLGVLGVGLYFGAEALFQQTRDFITGGPNIIQRAVEQLIGPAGFSFGGQTYTTQQLAQRINDLGSAFLGQSGGSAVHVVTVVGGRLLDALLVIIVSFYLLLSGNKLGKYMLTFMPSDNRERTGYIAGRIQTVLGAYLRGQLLLIILMSIVSFLILQFVFQVPYAVPLGIITGFLEILPLLGPAIAAALAASVALAAHGPGAAIGVIVAYLILRELEDQLVMPMVVGRAVELHPVITIFAVLAGGAMAGVIGMVLAVPAAAAIKVILDFLYPTNPDTALEQARPGLEIAKQEAEQRGEPSDPVPAGSKS